MTTYSQGPDGKTYTDAARPAPVQRRIGGFPDKDDIADRLEQCYSIHGGKPCYASDKKVHRAVDLHDAVTEIRRLRAALKGAEEHFETIIEIAANKTRDWANEATQIAVHTEAAKGAGLMLSAQFTAS